MTVDYYESISLIERLHRHFLEVVKVELDRIGVQDINNVQSLILYNIGEDELTVGELTARGYYLGSNVSYNVKKMGENGYLEQARSLHDKRSVRVKLSLKGRELCERLEKCFEFHRESLKNFGVDEAEFEALNKTLRNIERFWNQSLTYNNTSAVNY